MNTFIQYCLIVLFIITTIEIKNIRGAFKKKPPTTFVVVDNSTSTERFMKLVKHCFTSFSTWMVLLG
ncbi:unnamed protein product [Schistosoma margrebowiei]|uniref:Uncharacterized protein n=1 Tax=Schistosoma margrebowiei TaxID=48269 RepID=A0AA85AJ29_9TREM|nr:unnamed protein product [Schistosoma margrebowiei]